MHTKRIMFATLSVFIVVLFMSGVVCYYLNDFVQSAPDTPEKVLRILNDTYFYVPIITATVAAQMTVKLLRRTP